MSTGLLSGQPVNYLGRSVDLLLFDNLPTVGGGDMQVIQALVLPGMQGAEITGIEKAVQRFMLELLTEVGSMPFAPTRGCTFMLDARSGIWRTPADVINSFNVAMIQIKANLVGDELPTDPTDECIADATLTSVTITLDSVTIAIQYTSLAGTSRSIIYPLRTTRY